MYLYETHLHTSPVSACATASVRENLEYYKSLGYDGVFITDHFIDGNIGGDRSLPWEQQLCFYCSAYEEGKAIGKELGLKVFFGVECSYKGTDFLLYGLTYSRLKEFSHWKEMKKSQLLAQLKEEGVLVIQAHPFREASYIDHIRIYPPQIHGVEIYNACREERTNRMAALFAREYELIPFAGTDNHSGNKMKRLGGMAAKTPLVDEADFVRRVLAGEMTPFAMNAKEPTKLQIDYLTEERN